MSFDRYHWGWPASSIAALVATVLVPHPSSVGLFLHALFDWLHVPVFGLISLAVLALMPKTWQTWQRFGVAFIGALTLGIFSEAIQIPMSRDASWEDIVADGAGATGFLSIAYAWGSYARGPSTWRRTRRVAILSAISGLFILSWSALPLFSVSSAIIQRNSQFPVIFNGDIDSERTFVRKQNVHADTRWSSSQRRHFTRLELMDGRWPGLALHDPAPDWSSFSNLLFNLELEGEAPVEITIRVHDKAHKLGNQAYDDRFNRKFTLHAGRTRLRIPIVDIENAPRKRQMNMAAIDGLMIFSRSQHAGRAIRLYEIRLD